MTRKERFFCDALMHRVANGSDVSEDTLMKAALQSFGFCYMNDEKAEAAALRRAKRLLLRPDIRARMSGLFENAQFFVTDAVKAHVKHITSGNYQALKDYWAMTQGPITKQIDVRKVSAHVSFEADRNPKPMHARSLTGKNLVLDGVTGEVREATVVPASESVEEVQTLYSDPVAYDKAIEQELADARNAWRLSVDDDDATSDANATESEGKHDGAREAGTDSHP